MSGTPPIRVLVVDDSALVRGLLSEIINRQTDMVCVGAAADALVAREMIRSLDPDVITLDIEMPHMDGLEFLSRLMRLRPMPVVMVSALTERGADATLRALELGAVDFVPKPRAGVVNGLRQLEADITGKIRTAAGAQVRRLTAAPPTPTPALAPGPDETPPAATFPEWTTWTSRQASDRIIFIGASTGGTKATLAVLSGLPADSPAIMVTQHMPAGFTRSYAARLDTMCRIRVAEAIDGEPVLAGHAYIAPGGLHLSVARVGGRCVARVSAGEPVNRHRPSVEVLFDSAARVVGGQAIGVMLTGMGADGARAMVRMREAGSWNLVQDEASCVIFGMPREAIAHGAAHEVLPLHQIAPRLLERLRIGTGAMASAGAAAQRA